MNVYAANNLNSVTGIIQYVTSLIQTYLIPMVLTLALIFFLWGIVKFIYNQNNAEKRKKALSTFLFGVLALFVMLGILGIVQVVVNTFSPGTNSVVPQLKLQSTSKVKLNQ